jgi:hypothetical protein
MAASNRTQDNSAWDTAGYSRPTSKFNITCNSGMLQASIVSNRKPGGIPDYTWLTEQSLRLAGGF